MKFDSFTIQKSIIKCQKHRNKIMTLDFLKKMHICLRLFNPTKILYQVLGISCLGHHLIALCLHISQTKFLSIYTAFFLRDVYLDSFLPQLLFAVEFWKFFIYRSMSTLTDE